MRISQQNQICRELEWMAQFQLRMERKKVWKINEGQAKKPRRYNNII